MAPELLTVILASVSCVAFCLVILMLVVVLYRKDPLCCRFRPRQTQDYVVRTMEHRPHFHGRHSLIGIARNARAASLNRRPAAPQLPGGPFVIGKPHDYHMDGRLPPLPSYQSVRKEDRQRHIHGVIAQRFRLHGEPPPTYEETIHRSLSSADVHTSDEHLNLHSPSPASTAPPLRPADSTE